MIVLSTFGALVLAGMYSGQQYFVPEEMEAPVASMERYAEHKRTLEIKPTGETCRWMAENGVEPIPTSYQVNESTLNAAPDSQQILRDAGSYQIVVAPGCEDLSETH